MQNILAYEVRACACSSPLFSLFLCRFFSFAGHLVAFNLVGRVFRKAFMTLRRVKYSCLVKNIFSFLTSTHLDHSISALEKAEKICRFKECIGIWKASLTISQVTSRRIRLVSESKLK